SSSVSALEVKMSVGVGVGLGRSMLGDCPWIDVLGVGSKVPGPELATMTAITTMTTTAAAAAAMMIGTGERFFFGGGMAMKPAGPAGGYPPGGAAAIRPVPPSAPIAGAPQPGPGTFGEP